MARRGHNVEGVEISSGSPDRNRKALDVLRRTGIHKLMATHMDRLMRAMERRIAADPEAALAAANGPWDSQDGRLSLTLKIRVRARKGAV